MKTVKKSSCAKKEKVVLPDYDAYTAALDVKHYFTARENLVRPGFCFTGGGGACVREGAEGMGEKRG